MIHAMITSIYSCVWIVLALPVYGLVLPAGFYIGRELAQAEYRYIEYYCNNKRSDMPWYAPWTLKAWKTQQGTIYWKSILDWVLPSIVSICSIGIHTYLYR